MAGWVLAGAVRFEWFFRGWYVRGCASGHSWARQARQGRARPVVVLLWHGRRGKVGSTRHVEIRRGRRGALCFGKCWRGEDGPGRRGKISLGRIGASRHGRRVGRRQATMCHGRAGVSVRVTGCWAVRVARGLSWQAWFGSLVRVRRAWQSMTGQGSVTAWQARMDRLVCLGVFVSVSHVEARRGRRGKQCCGPPGKIRHGVSGLAGEVRGGSTRSGLSGPGRHGVEWSVLVS